MIKYNTLITSAIFSIALILTGCNRELPDSSTTLPETFRITIGTPSSIEDARTSLGALSDSGTRAVHWSSGDRISLNGQPSIPLPEMSEQHCSAIFEFAEQPSLPYHLLYPASAYNGEQSILLPTIQEAADNSFGEGAQLMAAYIEEEGENIIMHHLTAVIRLRLTRATTEEDRRHHEIAYVEFRGNASEQISGLFTIDYATSTITGCDVSSASQSVIAKVGKSLSTDMATDIFIVVPAIEYTKGFTVRIVDVNNHYMDRQTLKTKHPQAGEILAMPAFEFIPTGTLIGVDTPTSL